jgi:hypothetical protein
MESCGQQSEHRVETLIERNVTAVTSYGFAFAHFQFAGIEVHLFPALASLSRPANRLPVLDRLCLVTYEQLRTDDNDWQVLRG